MKRGGAGQNLLGFLFFFLPVTVAVSVSIIVFSAMQGLGEGKEALVSVVMLIVCFVLSAAAALVEYIRHKVQVERRVQEILEGTARMAQGDFSVRFTSLDSWGYYDDFDRIKENLNTLAKELSKTETLHSDFVASVSHEIKTPLAMLNSHAQLLAKGNLSPEKTKYHAERLAQASERLSALVTNVLKLSKLENGEVLPEYKTVDATESLAEHILSLEGAMDSKGLLLETDIQDGVTVSVPDGFWDILCGNLLSNAVKFTDCGGTVRVSLKSVGKETVLSVADTGCGFCAKDGERIFDKFYQADTSRRSEGNGLGLALVKKVIERMGGEISVVSEVGKGSTFTVCLQSEPQGGGV